MNQQYVELVDKFKQLSDEEKMQEIINNINELLKLLYFTNNTVDSSNQLLPIINEYSDESEYYDALFTRIISLKEETAKLINTFKNN